MIRILLAAAFVMLIFQEKAVIGNMNQLTMVDTLQGDNYLPIRTAVGILQHHKPDLDQFRILVVLTGESTMVILMKNETASSGRRNFGVRLEPAAELNTHELDVLMSNMDRLKVLETLQGRSFRAIQVAMGAFQQHGLDVTKYKVTVLREADSLVTTFTDKEGTPGGRGNPGRRPGFEVVLCARDLRVLRSNFIR